MPDLLEMKILIIGPGPATIGQSGEALEGALEACQALSAQGCSIITVDANPDAVFNEKPWSQQPCIAPLVPDSIAQVLDRERPDAILTPFSGRNGLTLISNLYHNDTNLNKKTHLWGPSIRCMDNIRDRDALQSTLTAIGLETPSIFTVNGVEAAIEKAQQLGFPVVLRCDDAHVLPDGLLLYNQDELNHIGATLAGESDSKFSVETSLLDWQQIELEVMRDHTGRSLLIGGVEYLDTAGVHPGDAIGVCPPQTLPQSLEAELFKQASAIANHLDIVGGATIRFAYQLPEEKSLVLAVHPRYTTASAIVTRVSGVPVAQMATLLAAGYTLEQLPDKIPLPETPKAIQEVVGVKWPRWDFKLLSPGQNRLGPQMQATGHSICYAISFKEALQKASRSDQNPNGGLAFSADQFEDDALETLLPSLSTPSSDRLFKVYAALTKGADVEEIVRRTHMSIWFVEQLLQLVETAQQINLQRNNMPEDDLLRRAKSEGFSNDALGRLSGRPIEQIEAQLKKAGVVQKWRRMPGKGQNLRYGTYGTSPALPAVSGERKIIILGNGAYGIGNGAECDYGIFKAAQTSAEMGYSPIIVNSNLSSQVTGHSSPCACYCEPMSIEDIKAVIQFEQPIGIITQFAGTTADALAAALSPMDCELLGTPWAAHQVRQDPAHLKEHTRQLGIPQPSSVLASTGSEALQSAVQMGFPVLINRLHASPIILIPNRPSFEQYIADNPISEEDPLWIEQLLEYAIEAQAEILCDGTAAHTLAVMEHIELAGVHAGDSAAVLPPYSIAPRHMDTISEYCQKISTALNIKGLINIRFGIYRDTVYFLNAGSNISRNLAMVTKAMGVPVVAWATRLLLGDTLTELDMTSPTSRSCCVRAPVFPFNAFSKIDPLLGPNMRATGQAMAVSNTFGMAYFKAMASTSTPLPTRGTVLITVTDEDKTSIVEPARIFSELGFRIMSTRGTLKTLAEHGIESILVRKLGFGRPNLVDEIKNGHVQIVINTPTGGQGQIDDSMIRKAAIGCRIVNITTPASALAAAKGIAAALAKG